VLRASARPIPWFPGSLVPTVPVGMPSATLCVVSLSTAGDSSRLTDGTHEYRITSQNDPTGSIADRAWFTRLPA
jgi:hypothetical protein